GHLRSVPTAGAAGARAAAGVAGGAACLPAVSVMSPPGGVTPSFGVQEKELPRDQGQVDGAADAAALPDVLVLPGGTGDGHRVGDQALVHGGLEVGQRGAQRDYAALGGRVLVGDGKAAQPVVHGSGQPGRADVVVGV